MQSSFATFKQNYFSSNGKVALRYMGLMGYFEGNGFTTNPKGGLLVDYGGSNNAQITALANSFENNGKRSSTESLRRLVTSPETAMFCRLP